MTMIKKNFFTKSKLGKMNFCLRKILKPSAVALRYLCLGLSVCACANYVTFVCTVGGSVVLDGYQSSVGSVSEAHCPDNMNLENVTDPSPNSRRKSAGVRSLPARWCCERRISRSMDPNFAVLEIEVPGLHLMASCR